jgi:hypothetical protein
MAKWSIYHEPPSSTGEPQPVRDAWDKQLQAQAEADAELKAALAEIEAG